MIDQETLRKLREMKLGGMAEGFEELLGRAPSHDMTAIEVVGTLVDREWSGRENRRLARLLKLAKIGQDACLEDVRCEPGRGLDKAVLRDLATGRWIESKLNVILVGKTGVGKSYLAAALTHAACRQGRRALYARVPRRPEYAHRSRVEAAISGEAAQPVRQPSHRNKPPEPSRRSKPVRIVHACVAP